MVHAAVSDIDGGRFRYLERSARPALELAGARAMPLRAWVGDCEARQAGQGADTLMPLRLRCGDERFSFDLALQAERPKVLHGAQGYSEKSGVPGSASYYYSYPFLSAQGTVQIGGDSVDVRGAAWLDHEWGSAVLAPGQSGWDWFSLRFDDGSALMLFRIRDDADAAVAVRGTLVEADGSVHPFGEGVVTAEPLTAWTSPESGVRYPLEWRLRSERFALDLRVAPHFRGQELLTSVRYWEGAIAARGVRGKREVIGEGYLELTGYRPARR
jgi:predicted secreted hydrolase